MRGAIVLLILIAGCSPESGEDENGRSIVPAVIAVMSTGPSEPIALPGLSSRSEWIGRLDRLVVDAASGNLFAIDRIHQRVSEFSRDGALVQTFGGRIGDGPGEVQNILSFEVTSDQLYILDERAPKLLVFRRDGRLEEEHRLPTQYHDFAMLSPSRLVALPGAGGGLVDILSIEADSVRILSSIGGEGFRDGSRCAIGCKVVTDREGRIIVLQGDAPRILVLDRQGTLLREIALDETPSIQRWIDEESRLLGDRPGIVGGKTFAWDIALVVGKPAFVITILPARVHERGRQLWIVPRNGATIQRFGFDKLTLGNSVAVWGDTAYAIDVSDGGVYRVVLSASSAKVR